MCGIIGYVGDKDPKEILLDALKRLEYRGYDSAGVAIFDSERVELFRSEGRLERLEKKLADRTFNGTMGIGHTRWATHGAPTEINAHPHRVGTVTLIHNGIIENYLEHKGAIAAKGRKVLSDTDSEVVAHLLDLEIVGGKTLREAVMNVLPGLRGSFAFVIMNDKEPDSLIGARCGPPLMVGLGDGENYLISDVQAILHRTKRFIYLEDGQFAICRRDGVSISDERGNSVTADVKTIEWNPEQSEKRGFSHYMLKEIHDQPQALTQTIEGNIDHNRGIVSLSELAPLSYHITRIQRISIAACGTAKYAALVGKYYLERFTGLPVDVDFASEFRYRDPLLSKETLLLLISQSGETADTLAALRLGKQRGVSTLAICNVRHSTLARESDAVLYTDAGPEIGVASTKAFTTQLTVLYMLAIQLGLWRDRLGENRCVELTRDLIRLPYYIDKALGIEKEVEEIAVELQDHPFFFYIGRGVNFPIALEGALKLKEISYIHAEGYPAGELKHGPIALIDKSVVTVVLCPRESPENTKGLPDTLYEKLMSNLQEAKARGGTILGIGTEKDEFLKSQCEFFLGLPLVPWALNPILLSIPAQLFAYYVALKRGCDVDKPRNLAKSVTVE